MSARTAPAPSAAVSSWLHVVRLLARLSYRRPAPARLPRAAQVRALAKLLDEAVATQQTVDRAVAACGEPGPVSGQTAQDCGRQSVTVHRSLGLLRDLPLADTDLVEARAYAGRLLAYDQWMLRQALDLAFTVHPDARTEAARLQINGLGRPADDLRRLRDDLVAQAEALQAPAAARGGPGLVDRSRP